MGQTRHWLISGSSKFRYEKGNVIGSIGIHLDITEAKNNRELLEEQKIGVRHYLSVMFLWVLFLEKMINLFRTNSTFDELMGVKKERGFRNFNGKICPSVKTSNKELLEEDE